VVKEINLVSIPGTAIIEMNIVPSNVSLSESILGPLKGHAFGHSAQAPLPPIIDEEIVEDEDEKDEYEMLISMTFKPTNSFLILEKCSFLIHTHMEH
jgi:hypothetical protein